MLAAGRKAQGGGSVGGNGAFVGETILIGSLPGGAYVTIVALVVGTGRGDEFLAGRQLLAAVRLWLEDDVMVDGTGHSLQVKTLGGETADVLFEANPVVTVADGKLIVKS